MEDENDCNCDAMGQYYIEGVPYFCGCKKGQEWRRTAKPKFTTRQKLTATQKALDVAVGGLEEGKTALYDALHGSDGGSLAMLSREYALCSVREIEKALVTIKELTEQAERNK